MKLLFPLLFVASTAISATFDQPPAPPQPTAPASVDAIRERISAANSTLPPQISEVVKMSEAGVNEQTIVSYVNASPGFALKANDVIVLHERGVSTPIINAMLQHTPTTQLSPSAIAAAAASAPPPATATVATTSNPNPPIVYPTPVTEATPLTRPEVVYTMPIYSYPSSVIIMGSSYYQRPYSYGGYYGGFRPYSRGCYGSPYVSVGFRGGYCGPSYRCRY